MKSQRAGRRRRTRSEIAALLGRYQRSGKTVRAFAKAEDVGAASLYAWLRREREEGGAPAVVEVMRTPEMPTTFGVQTPNGYRVEVPASFSEESLQRLLGVLGS
jgi:transposase-like protein